MVEALRVKDDAALAQVGFWVRVTAGLSVIGSVASVIGVVLAVWALVVTYNPPGQTSQLDPNTIKSSSLPSP